MKLISPIQYPLPLSTEQDRAKAAINAGKSVAVKACAGSGKTHTANYITYNYADRVELIPFARSLREEQSAKFADFGHINVSNFHQRGKRCLGNCRVDERKVVDIAKNLYDVLGRKIAAIVKAAKTEGYGLYEDSLTMDQICVKYGYRLTEKEADMFEESLEEMACKVLEISDKDTKTIDFEDMLRLPVVYGRGIMLPSNALIVLDEVQDFTPLSFCFLKECIVSKDHQVLMIGDPERQALMQFAGASVELFDTMARYFGCEYYSLTENRRCAKAIVAAAPFKGDMVALPDAPEGEVTTMGMDDVMSDIMNGLYTHDAVLSETNAPILTLGIKLIIQGIPVRMRTNRIDKIIMRYAYKYLDTRKFPVGSMTEHLQNDVQESAADGADVSEFSDFVKCVEALETYCLAKGILKPAWKSRRPIHPIQIALETLTSGDEGITLMTGHTAKGLEWNTVFHIPTAVKAPEQDWQVHQNQCVSHVIATRARLKFVTLN